MAATGSGAFHLRQFAHMVECVDPIKRFPPITVARIQTKSGTAVACDLSCCFIMGK